MTNRTKSSTLRLLKQEKERLISLIGQKMILANKLDLECATHTREINRLTYEITYIENEIKNEYL